MQIDEIKIDLRVFILDNILFGYGDGFEDDYSFQDDGIIDSTGILELISFVEEKYSISISDNELVPENIDSLNRLSSFVYNKTRNGNSL